MTWLETRGMLAKLLATENLIVEHDGNAQTAAFNTETRVLTLPILKTENENVYNMFVAHECSHALYTPTNWADEIPNNVPFDFVNVVEDVRIEKLIQVKFPGLRVDFTKGYDQLNEQDFFSIADKDVNKMSFIDRINLHFKLGARALITFSDEEQSLVDAVNQCETYTDVVEVATQLAEFVKAQREKQSTDIEMESPNTTDGEGEQQSSQMKSDDTTEGESEEQQDNDTGDGYESPESETSTNEFESETQQSMDENMKQLSPLSSTNYNYVHTPIEGLDFIVDVDTLRSSFRHVSHEYLGIATGQYDQFLNSIKRDVNFLVQQFEMKKSADAYARTTINKTGELDMNSLHAYKLTDDLFLRQSVTPDGKNHGMIMYLDWSGSMDNICHDTVKQIILLVQFCRKVQIPFEVYTFTSGNNYDEGRDHYKPEYDKHIILRGVVHMVQVLTSTAKRNDLDQDLYNLFAQSSGLASSPHLMMGGTPLDNALFALPQIVDRFRSNTKAQKVSFVCITDGESSPVVNWQTRTYERTGESYTRGESNWGNPVMVRDGAKVLPLDFDRLSTGKIASWLETKISDLSITHIYLGSQSQCERYAHNIGVDMDAQALKKVKSVVTTSDGWSLISFINPKGFGQAQDEIDVEAGESKAKIKSALKKYLQSKSTNKVVLSALAEQFS